MCRISGCAQCGARCDARIMAAAAAATGQHLPAPGRRATAGNGPGAECSGPAHLVRPAAQGHGGRGSWRMSSFRAFRIHEEGKKIVGRFEQLRLADLSPGEVVVRVTHSDINYKDALAATGAGKILRRYPLVGGIDLAGGVESSKDAGYRPGEAVLVTGCGLSESHERGYGQFERAPGAWV